MSTPSADSAIRKLKRPVRSHKKSRMGCLQCKKRRVKCDEVHPSCGNCERRRTDCVYEPFCVQQRAQQSTSNQKTSPVSPTDETPSPISPHDAQNPPIQQNVEQRVSLRQQPTPTPFSTMEMTSFRLLHHYTMVTCNTMSYSSDCLFSLQYAVPQLAFANPALMHGILSLASLHLHRLYADPNHSDQDYLELALTHRNQIQKFFHQVTDPDVTSITNSFLGIFSMSHWPNGQADVFGLLSRVYVAMKRRRAISKESLVPLSLHHIPYLQWQASLFSGSSASSSSTNPGYPEAGIPFVDALNHIHLPTPNFPDPHEVEDPHTSEVYRKAVRDLSESWLLFQKPGAEMTGALLWPSRFSDQFHQFLVVEKRQRALVLLYYYCSMIHWLSSRGCWWTEHLASSLNHVSFLLQERWMACLPPMVT